jgi:small-conductance mechanosensitive channel
MKRTYRSYAAAGLAVVFVTLAALAIAAPVPAQKAPPGAPILLKGRTVFTLHTGVGSISAAERAEIVSRRLEEIVASPLKTVSPQLKKTDGGWMVTVRGQAVISVTEADAKAENTPVEALAQKWAAALGPALEEGRGTSLRELLWRLAKTAFVIVVAVGLMLGLRWGRKRLMAALEARREQVPALRLRELELVSTDRMFGGLRTALIAVSLFLAVVVVGVAALLVFEQFPATQGYAEAVALWLWRPLRDIGRGILGYLPNLFYILVIVLVTRVVLRVVSYLFLQAARGVISLEPWVHRDVARPTGQIVKAVVVILALFFIAPLIPGTGSRAAQAITIILGLMVSFGSTSTVGNVIAGIVLTYMRPYKLGERVQVGSVTGDVVERTFLYTKLRTIKNEEVIVPSLQAISSAITNYSALAPERGLILHTSVTIGYDAPWRKVHELLLGAAAKTKGVEKDPEPFVWQTALNDFFVTYQLNIYTHRADRMMDIYAELHQRIQDAFNEGGIEILSPHYFQVRDGNLSTIPESQRAPGYQPRRLLVDARIAGVTAPAAAAAPAPLAEPAPAPAPPADSEPPASG